MYKSRGFSEKIKFQIFIKETYLSDAEFYKDSKCGFIFSLRVLIKQLLWKNINFVDDFWEFLIGIYNRKKCTFCDFFAHLCISEIYFSEMSFLKKINIPFIISSLVSFWTSGGRILCFLSNFASNIWKIWSFQYFFSVFQKINIPTICLWS